ncbi:MAG: hypothetical protein KGJ34_00340 [Patescibacteria group bacterium]|nr:hypothetical protein [Patescibacteria group bacterium]
MRKILVRILGSVFVATSLVLGLAATAAAQTTTYATTTPGAPNTGAGGDVAMNILLLCVSAVVVLAGASYLVFRRPH